MEESAPKRRRVSPDPEAPTAASTPAAQAPTNLPATTTSQSPNRQPRPSFASPTRASLSRYNPQILERRRSAFLSPPKVTTTASAPSNPTPAAARPPPEAAGNIGASESNQPEDTARTNSRYTTTSDELPGWADRATTTNTHKTKLETVPSPRARRRR
ncbi:hypothetical protein J3459_006736 [Metarhizium acridum]|nr:hypothetical protein J3459_006736 [Metarhizium acridum]